MNLEPSITCGRCGCSATVDRWKLAPGGELPPNRFQCPTCAWAFERLPFGTKYGQHQIKLATVQSELPLAGRAIR